MTTLPPLSLYVHVPWCVRKCPYCDFNSHGVGHDSALPERAYVDALLDDLDAELALARGRELVSIFIGGGTPSLLSGAAYRRLLQAIEARLPFASDIEITLEANPGAVEHDRFAAYREAGINRLSLGVQSFQSLQLERLGRIHDGDEAAQALRNARAAGFDNVNLDLMHGLPEQGVEDALADIEQALALAPEHISWYQLTLEPNTEFYSQPPRLPDEDVLCDIQEAGHARLEAAGYHRYEISAYTRPDHQARHNLNYWTFGDYLGIGAGAHGKLSAWQTDGALAIERRWKVRQPEAYLRRAQDPRGFVAGRRALETQELPLEFLMNALRLTEGVPRYYWRERSGQPDTLLDARLEEARAKGLLRDPAQRLQASPHGLLFLNDLLALCDEQ
ncbi:radical SAM family heme chaperone HemW [Chromohalobacter nigrandesensis]|uniref:radical SAM family heme chaperone HemW n=1 Tax=Chromohalobacter nigrandesensis TaxID=119863 RepID=UPI001FF3EFF6|nr:radical SAM family heme chaperone HemW [Chromohalobacter nigrandesensis]MCK0744776.1 radical SAM family heme chaperone HemW [Chromohalobacter nigrandesensis]